MTAGSYDFWLFDLDGTLVDIEPWYPRAVIGRVGDELGVDFDEHEAEVLWYGVGGTRDEYLANHSLAPETFWQTFHEVENPRERARATYLYDDAAAFVDDLERPVGLVTHCQRYLTDPVLDGLEVREWFDSVVCCSDATGWKPDPDPVYRLMRAMDVDPAAEAGVLVGDDPADVGAAQAAGLDAVQVVRRSGEDGGLATVDDVPAADERPVAAADGGDPDEEPVRIASFSQLS